MRKDLPYLIGVRRKWRCILRKQLHPLSDAASAASQDLQREKMTLQRPFRTCEYLPPELLIDIFEFLYLNDTTPRKSKGNSSHKLLKLMLVCKSFNQMIQTTPAFWTELWLVRTTRNTEEQEAGWIEWMRKHITKSGGLPLRVFFMLSRMPLSRIFPILLPTSSRWVHLTISPWAPFPESSFSPSDIQPLFDAQIPKLRSLSVKGLGRWLDDIFDIGTVFRHAPRLAKLEWQDRFVVFRPDSEQTGTAEEYVHLRSLEGTRYDFAQNTLEVLSIEGVAPPITLETMTMHRLRFLSLGGFGQLCSFLERWQLPVLEELHIAGSPYYQSTGLASPTFPALKRIEWLEHELDPALQDNQSSSSLLIRVLAASPQLECFCISYRKPSIPTYLNFRRMCEEPTDRISPFLATGYGTGAPTYCPSLRELRLHEAGLDELERLADIRPQLEIFEVVALRHDPAASSFGGYMERLAKVGEHVKVTFHEWV